EARCERCRARERHAAVGRAHAVQAAEAGRDPDGAGAVRPQRKFAEATRDRRRGAARGAARNALRADRIERRAVVHVLAVQAVGELVADRAPDHARARREEPPDRGSSSLRGDVRGKPRRLSEAGALSGDVENVLDREREPVKRPRSRWVRLTCILLAQRAELAHRLGLGAQHVVHARAFLKPSDPRHSTTSAPSERAVTSRRRNPHRAALQPCGLSHWWRGCGTEFRTHRPMPHEHGHGGMGAPRPAGEDRPSPAPESPASGETGRTATTHDRPADVVETLTFSQHERELRVIVDLIPHHIAVAAPDGARIYANRVMLDYYGFTTGDVQE